MRPGVSFSFLLMAHVALAQKQPINYGSIDRQVRTIDASSPDDLAQKLTWAYNTDFERARAIFSWIAQHISYEYKDPGSHVSNKVSNTINDDDKDTSALTPLNKLVAEEVLKKRVALCYGYSHLFKYLCDYANIPCEIVNGYARGDFNKIGANFRTNHSWNAISLDSSWYLVDVTWASGYFSYKDNNFIKRFDDQYFLTAPAQFALDHFPDDLKWTLLEQPPAISEFQNGPYKARCFMKYEIISYWPKQGVIKASVGDTINFAMQMKLPTDRRIGGGSVDDTVSLFSMPVAVYCKPSLVDQGFIHYNYVVTSQNIQWLQLVYNDDMILRYRLDIRTKRFTSRE